MNAKKQIFMKQNPDDRQTKWRNAKKKSVVVFVIILLESTRTQYSIYIDILATIIYNLEGLRRVSLLLKTHIQSVDWVKLMPNKTSPKYYANTNFIIRKCNIWSVCIVSTCYLQAGRTSQLACEHKHTLVN